MKTVLWKKKFGKLSLQIVQFGQPPYPEHIRPFTVERLSSARYRHHANFKTYEEALACAMELGAKANEERCL